MKQIYINCTNRSYYAWLLYNYFHKCNGTYNFCVIYKLIYIHFKKDYWILVYTVLQNIKAFDRLK